MKATLINGAKYLVLDFNQAKAELESLYEAKILPNPLHKQIDSTTARYRKDAVEEYELSEDENYIEVRFVSGHKMQFSYLFMEGYTSNAELLATLDSYLNV